MQDFSIYCDSSSITINVTFCPFCFLKKFGIRLLAAEKVGFLYFADAEGGKHAPAENLYIPCPGLFSLFFLLSSAQNIKIA